MRREWLRGFLARKSAPRNAAQFIAATLGRGGHDLRKAMESRHITACELLGMTTTDTLHSGRTTPIAAAADTAATPRATILSLAVLLGAAEDATSRGSWRNPSSDNRAYFTALSEWGYPLSEVEQLALNPNGQTEPTSADAPSGEDAAGSGLPECPSEVPVDGDADIDVAAREASSEVA